MKFLICGLFLLSSVVHADGTLSCALYKYEKYTGFKKGVPKERDVPEEIDPNSKYNLAYHVGGDSRDLEIPVNSKVVEGKTILFNPKGKHINLNVYYEVYRFGRVDKSDQDSIWSFSFQNVVVVDGYANGLLTVYKSRRQYLKRQLHLKLGKVDSANELGETYYYEVDKYKDVPRPEFFGEEAQLEADLKYRDKYLNQFAETALMGFSLGECLLKN